MSGEGGGDLPPDEDPELAQIPANKNLEDWHVAGVRLYRLLPPGEFASLVRDMIDLADVEEAMQRHACKLAIILAKFKSRRHKAA